MKQLHKPLANATGRIKISSKGSKFFIAVLIGGLATFFCSILLIQGIRKVKLVKVLTIAFLLHNFIIALLLTFVHQNKTTWMFPWIVESSISTFASFILFLVRQLQRSFIRMLFQNFLKVVSSCLLRQFRGSYIRMLSQTSLKVVSSCLVIRMSSSYVQVQVASPTSLSVFKAFLVIFIIPAIYHLLVSSFIIIFH